MKAYIVAGLLPRYEKLGWEGIVELKANHQPREKLNRVNF